MKIDPNRRPLNPRISNIALDSNALDRLRKKAASLIRQHRSAIERVAAALLDKRTLTGAEVDDLLKQG